MMEQSSRRTVHRVRHELHLREVVVDRVAALGENFLAITFRGESLGGFLSLSFDDHVKFMFDGPDGQVRRDYTPRRFAVQSAVRPAVQSTPHPGPRSEAHQAELTLEFALHGSGAASDWARRAQPGDRAIIGGPRGSMIIPMDFDWHLLAGDATALPAMRRRIEELPAGSRVLVVAAAAPADRILPDGPAQVTAHWVDDDTALPEAVRALALPPGEGFVWAAGEAATMRALREVLATDKALPKEAMRVSAYWKRGVADHHENLE